MGELCWQGPAPRHRQGTRGLTYSETFTEVLERSQNGSCDKKHQVQRNLRILRRDMNWILFGGDMLRARGRTKDDPAGPPW